MNTKKAFVLLAIGILPLSFSVLANNTKDAEINSDKQINLIESDCREGETYCGEGVFEMCKNGEWVVVENCHANDKMCDPNGSGCIECIPAEYNSAENALLIEPDTRVESVLCTSTCKDWYKIEVPSGKALYASISWYSAGGVYLEMYDASGTNRVARLNEFMELGYNNTGETAIFYLKAFNDSSGYRFSLYSIQTHIMDEYTSRQF